MPLTHVSQFTISEHRNDDQHVSQQVDYSGEDKHTGQQRRGPDGARAGVQRMRDVSNVPEVPDERVVF